MTTNEIEEFQSRVNVLVEELNDKNQQIEKVQAQKQELLDAQIKSKELGVEIEGHYEEIEELNKRYSIALKDNVSVYIELVQSIKELSSRHNKFFTNEVGLVKMQNECSMLKKQLEQKEKECEDIRSKDLFVMNKQLVKQIEDQID